MKKLIVFLSILVVVAGCGAGTKVSPQVLQGYHTDLSKSDRALVVFCRTFHVNSGGVNSKVFIDGYNILDAKSGCQPVELPAGKHQLNITIHKSTIPWFQKGPYALPMVFNLASGDVKYIHFSAGRRFIKFSDTDIPSEPLQNLRTMVLSSVYVSEYERLAQKRAEEEKIAKAKREREEAELNNMINTVNNLLDKGDMPALKLYINLNPQAVTYIPDDKVRLLFVGPIGMQVGDIIKYKQKKMSDVLLAAKIESGNASYKIFSMDEIAVLNEYGVTDEIIAAMIRVTNKINEQLSQEEKERRFLQQQQELIARTQQKTLAQQQAPVNNGSPSGVDSLMHDAASAAGKQIGKQIFNKVLSNLF